MPQLSILIKTFICYFVTGKLPAEAIARQRAKVAISV